MYHHESNTSIPTPPPQSIPQEYLVPSSTSESNDVLLELGMTKQDVLNLIASIPALSNKYSNLETKYLTLESNFSDLSSKHTILECQFSDLKKENVTLKSNLSSNSSSTEKNHNNLAQYTRRNSLKAHRLKNVPTWLSGTDFSKWVAIELNKLMPGIEISYQDIDTSHFLYYEYQGRKRYPVVIIKFIRRDLRNDILKRCGQDGYLDNSDVYFTDHLTVSNRKLLESAQDKYGQVWTDQCRIFVNSSGKKKEITEESDLFPSSNFVVVDDSSNIIDHPPIPHSSNTSTSNNVSGGYLRNLPPPRRNQRQRNSKQHFTKTRPMNSNRYYNNRNNRQQYAASQNMNNPYMHRWSPRNPQSTNYQNNNTSYNRQYSQYNHYNTPNYELSNTRNINSECTAPSLQAPSSNSDHFVQNSNHTNTNLPSLNFQMQPQAPSTSMQTRSAINNNVNNNVISNYQQSIPTQFSNSVSGHNW